MIFRCITADTETEREIKRADQIRIPTQPHIPSLYMLDLSDEKIHLHFGDPDRQHHIVKRISALGVDQEEFTTIADATYRFLAMCRAALTEPR